MDDVITLEGIENFRDFGGFALAGGGTVRHGRLFRAGHQARATAADLARLAGIPIRAVVDLRRKTERLEAPSRLTDLTVVVESDEGDRGVGPHMAFLHRGVATAEAVEAYLMDYYQNAFFEPRHRDLFARAFDALETIDGAVLIHCTAGKDRTGLLVALIRTALGGDWDETVADFVLTNQFTLTPARLAAAESNLKTLLGAAPCEAVLRGFCGVWSHHLEAAFAALEARCGSLDAYLTLLGVDPARRRRIAERLVS